MRFLFVSILLFQLFVFELAIANPYSSEHLRSYNVNPQAVTVSGVSSGAFMAVQMQVAFSQNIAGTASVAGGIFWCAEGNSQRAQNECMRNPKSLNVANYVKKAQELASQGKIDPLANLTSKKIYIFASPKDSVVNPVSSDKLNDFFKTFLSTKNIKRVQKPESAHGFLTVDQGGPCNLAIMPYILKCNFDMAGDILRSLYGALNPKGTANPSHLHILVQDEFGDAESVLFKQGWVYVPASCERNENCRLHVAFHGCQMNPDFIQNKFATLTGFNEWAETNNIIVFYPQAAKRLPDNPYACWDWYGYTGGDYVNQSGPQMAAVMKMIQRIMAQ